PPRSLHVALPSSSTGVSATWSLPGAAPAGGGRGARARGLGGGGAARPRHHPRSAVGDRVPGRVRGGDDRGYDARHRGERAPLRVYGEPLRRGEPPPRARLRGGEHRLRALPRLPDRGGGRPLHRPAPVRRGRQPNPPSFQRWSLRTRTTSRGRESISGSPVTTGARAMRAVATANASA